ncbi:hypothetical protein AgCh_006716 [Apium graveolens]
MAKRGGEGIALYSRGAPDRRRIIEDDPELGQSRLLEVDNRVVVPAKTHLRIIVTPADVPHSWVVPSSGVKCDAVPDPYGEVTLYRFPSLSIHRCEKKPHCEVKLL